MASFSRWSCPVRAFQEDKGYTRKIFTFEPNRNRNSCFPWILPIFQYCKFMKLPEKDYFTPVQTLKANLLQCMWHYSALNGPFINLVFLWERSVILPLFQTVIKKLNNISCFVNTTIFFGQWQYGTKLCHIVF